MFNVTLLTNLSPFGMAECQWYQ